MDRLWTPWRMQYVTSAAGAVGCLFCDKAADKRDAENLLLYRDELGFVMLNLYPYNSGHLMVAPYLHTADLAGLPRHVGSALFGLTQRSVVALTSEYHPDGFNVGLNLGRVAGAGVPDHVHIHVVPRWNGDTNFMPVTADTKVLPESLDQTYGRLARRFREA